MSISRELHIKRFMDTFFIINWPSSMSTNFGFLGFKTNSNLREFVNKMNLVRVKIFPLVSYNLIRFWGR